MSYIWEYKEPSEVDKSIASELANSLGINPVMGTLLVNRGIRTEEVYAICTIDLKEEEAAIRALRDKYRIPVLAFDKDLLMKADGAFHSSDFVYAVLLQY